MTIPGVDMPRHAMTDENGGFSCYQRSDEVPGGRHLLAVG